MATNQQLILNTLLQQQKETLDPNITDDDYFHLFVTEQVLKNYELSYDELQEGVVDSAGDGGIDAIYTFVNSELIQRGADLIDGKRGSRIDVYLIQSKNTNGFSEAAIDKCIASANDLFDFTKESADLRSVYNSDLLANREVFKSQYLHLASKFPVLTFHYSYASKGAEVHPNVERKIAQLQDALTRLFDKAELDFVFLNAATLIELSRREQIRTKGITLLDNPISTQDGGYIAIAPLRNYFDFISDENGALIRYFFDSNIRDYQGNVEVNSGIKDTLLATDSSEDFWWLNNGVTITASDASFSSKILQIEEPQIVNGLQTSFEIFNYFAKNKIDKERRNVLIRVVKTKDEKSRLSVIKATNSQTNIPPASLRATDPIHRDIEDFLFAKGFYYDRRKNYHKNQARPINKIVSIPYLAQIMMAVVQQKPDYARARPSTIIKSNADYEMIFNSSMPIDVYYKVICLHQAIENALKTHVAPKLTRPQIGDIRFHVTMYLTCRLTQKLRPRASDISEIELDNISTDLISESIDHTYIVYDAMGGNDGVAKGKEFVQELLVQIEGDLKQNKENRGGVKAHNKSILS